MIRLFAAELRKLTTVRANWLLTLVGLGFIGLFGALGLFLNIVELGGGFEGRSEQVAEAVMTIGSNSAFVLVVGILLITTEFRHGTMGRTLQLTPSRSRVLLAKLGAGAAYGVAFFAVALVMVAGLVLLAVAVRGVGLTIGGEVWTAVWQGLVGLALTAVFGVAFGALLRAQVVAITIGLIWIFAIESLFVFFLPRIGSWMPFHALNSMFVSEAARESMPPELPIIYHEPLVGLSIFLGYVAVFTLAAAVLLRHRDV